MFSAIQVKNLRDHDFAVNTTIQSIELDHGGEATPLQKIAAGDNAVIDDLQENWDEPWDEDVDENMAVWWLSQFNLGLKSTEADDQSSGKDVHSAHDPPNTKETENTKPLSK